MATANTTYDRSPEFNQAKSPAEPEPQTQGAPAAPASETLQSLLDKVVSATDKRPPEVQKFEFQQRAAKLFAASGLFADIKGQSPDQAIAQAFVKISLGDSMGFNPAESMTGIDIIQGRVAVGASLRAARMQRAGYSWDILQLNDKGCRLRLKYKGQLLMQEEKNDSTGEVREIPAVVSFTVEDAGRAQLAGKDNYKKYPPDMFFARAITRAQRWYAPGILGVDILDTTEAIELPPANGQDVSLAAKAAAGLEAIKRDNAARQTAAQPENPQPPEQEQAQPTPASQSAPPVEAASENQTEVHRPPRSRNSGKGESSGVPLDFSK